MEIARKNKPDAAGAALAWAADAASADRLISVTTGEFTLAAAAAEPGATAAVAAATTPRGAAGAWSGAAGAVGELSWTAFVGAATAAGAPTGAGRPAAFPVAAPGPA